MKKQILSIGNALSRAEQKTINGGNISMYGKCTAYCSTGEYKSRTCKGAGCDATDNLGCFWDDENGERQEKLCDLTIAGV